MPYNMLAGALGDTPLPREIQDFLERVKKNPQDYEAVLLTATLHVEPWRSDTLTKLLGATHSEARSWDEAQEILGKILQTLEDIHKKHLRDSRFNQLVKKEKELIPVVAAAFQKGIKEIEAKNVNWFEEILTKAYLANDPRTVGREFVLFSLPTQIGERVTNSRVPETHYARLGSALQLLAQQRQKENAAFKERVESKKQQR
jgi:hypothetical protein